MKKKLNKNIPFIPTTKGQLIPPGTVQGQGPTIDQILAEVQGRLRRINADQVYVASAVDALTQEIVAREKMLADFRAKEPSPLTPTKLPVGVN